MTLEQAKRELIKRYKYLYENANFILTPYMHKQTKEELDATNKEYNLKIKDLSIYLKLNIFEQSNKTIMSMFEEFLLSDIKMEDSRLYKFVESNRNNKEYLEKVKIGLLLLEEKNSKEFNFKTSLTIRNILEKNYRYIVEQSSDFTNKHNKLRVLDEYYRILGYQNNEKIYTSGRNIDLNDVSSLVIPIHKHVPHRDKNDIGVTKNKFITAIATGPHHKYNCSIFTEEEKQKVYLELHDELPYNLAIKCTLEEEYIDTLIDSRLKRPDNTECCGESFYINEQDIFIDPDDDLYRYYQICPHCGYIVNIPKEILSDGIKKRIEDRCNKDNRLFRKMYLYSELFSLDKNPTNGQRKILKNNQNN